MTSTDRECEWETYTEKTRMIQVRYRFVGGSMEIHPDDYYRWLWFSLDERDEMRRSI